MLAVAARMSLCMGALCVGRVGEADLSKNVCRVVGAVRHFNDTAGFSDTKMLKIRRLTVFDGSNLESKRVDNAV